MSNYINELIRSIIIKFPDASPADISELVTRELPTSTLREHFAYSLIPTVTAILRADRNAGLSTALGSPSNRSPRLERRRDGWAKFLESKLNTGPNEWKTVGDCTVDDIKFAAQERRNLATSHLVMADYYDTISSAMIEHRVQTVRELPGMPHPPFHSDND